MPTILQCVKAAREELKFLKGNGEKYWTLGLCAFGSRLLIEELEASGWKARMVRGRYMNADEDYLTRSPLIDGDFWNGFLHHWVECNDVIIDITADQFHDKNRKQIVVLPVGHEFYKKEAA